MSIRQKCIFEVISDQRQQKSSFFIINNNLSNKLIKTLKIKLVSNLTNSIFFSQKLLKFLVKLLSKNLYFSIGRRMRNRSPQPKPIFIPNNNWLNNSIKNLFYIRLFRKLLNPSLNLSPFIYLSFFNRNKF